MAYLPTDPTTGGPAVGTLTDDFFGQYGGTAGPTTTAPTVARTVPGLGAAGGGDTSWWNPQDPKGSLDKLLAGRPPTSQTILDLAPQLQAVGIEISPANAEGITSKIHVPGIGWTRILDGGVKGGAGTGGGQGTGWTFMPQGTTGPGGSIPMGGGAGGPRPYGTSAAPEAAPFSYAPFEAPALNETTDPGYQARLKMGTDALERSAAAKGTLLTGGTLKGLNRFAQDYASNEYGNVFSRALGAHTTNYQEAFQPWQQNFANATQTWQGNLAAQGQGANQLLGLAQLGGNAAAQQGTANTGYANQAGDLQTQKGNAQAAGTVGGANAVNQAIGQGQNLAQMYYLSRLYGQQPGAAGTVTPPYAGYGVYQ